MISYAAVWFQYRHKILQEIITHSEGILEADLMKMSGMSRANFFRVIKIFEDNGIIYKKKPSQAMVLIFPSSALLVCHEFGLSELPIILLDIDDYLMLNPKEAFEEKTLRRFFNGRKQISDDSTRKHKT